MGFFSYLFGAQSMYSSEPKNISREQIRILVSRTRVSSLNATEELLIEEAIDAARNNGRISMKKLNETLRSLVRTNKISDNDKTGVLKQFEMYFEKR